MGPINAVVRAVQQQRDDPAAVRAGLLIKIE
jgi:hypothetical protein